ncbi:Glutathione S-transferase Mu 2 [Nymphon striatum]|nr:Glutathione S-transferase Mu 2 [Nymphon striatum]
MTDVPKMGYWKIRGLAQPIRLIFEYAGATYDDNQFTAPEEWFPTKFDHGFDFPNLPYLIDGDVKLTQSNAIMRHLARKYKLAPKTEADERNCDVMAGIFADLKSSFSKMCYNATLNSMKSGHSRSLFIDHSLPPFPLPTNGSIVSSVGDDGYEKLKVDFMKNLPTTLKQISKFLGSKKWMIGDNILYVDFLMYELLECLKRFDASVFDDLKNLKDYMTRFEALPNIAKFMSSNRFIGYPINGPMATWGGK